MGTLGDGDAGVSPGVSPDAKKQDDLYENRSGHKKIIRVVTVMAYMVSVSFVAIVLSAYYVFLWQPPNPRLMHRSHLRADPQVEYLVHGPQIESSHEEVTQGHTDDLDKVIVLDEKISIETQQNRSPGGSKILKVIGVDPRSKDETRSSDYSPTSTTLWSPIVRALHATTDNPTADGMPVDSTGVYESVGVSMKSSLSAASPETSNSEINESTTRGTADSPTMIEAGDGLYDESVNHSTPTIGSGHKSYRAPVNYSTPTDFGGMDVGNGETDGKSSDDFSEANGANIDRASGKSTTLRAFEFLENSMNLKPEVQPISIRLEEGNVGTVETPEKSVVTRTQESLENSRNLRPEVQAISIGLQERTVETSGKLMTTRTQVSLDNSTNLRPKVQPVSIGSDERTVETSGKSDETLDNSTNLTPQMQPISMRLKERAVENSKKSMATRTRQSLENLTDLKPEVQPISIGLKERKLDTSEITMTTRTHELLENLTNRTPEVQQKSVPDGAQPETLGTTVASVQQRSFDWKPLGFTEPSTKLGSSISRVETKSPTNDTESVGKFSSTFQANEDVPIEIIAGPPGDGELPSEPSASAVPAVVQPESDFLDKDRESKDRLTQDGDFGFV